MANELGLFNIRVNLISPGAIFTPIFAKVTGKELAKEEADKAMKVVEKGLADF